LNLTITTDDVKAELSRRKHNKIWSYFPETGPLRRELYDKHMAFFAGGKDHRERTMMAANRIGKTEGAGGYEIILHATGLYPEWWEGHRFLKPVNILIGGETGKLVRDSIQLKLLGPLHEKGTGLIPKNCVLNTTPKQGIPLAVDEIYVKHLKGTSVIQFQSYDQGREAFQATERDVVWFDEEPPLDIYSEGLIRTMTTKGLIISTFTPLKGVSDTVLSLQDKASKGIGMIVTATWDDVPHLSDDDKEELWASLPPHQRDARSKGVPALGSGAIYPVSEVDFVVKPIVIPKHWKWCYGMDVGWNNTAAAWLAYDQESDTVYVTNDYKKGQSEPAVHASAIKQIRGAWVKGAIDPASKGRSQDDGKKLVDLYRGQGLDLSFADNAVEAGIFDVYERLSTGRLKVFSTCFKWLEEYRLYRRDEKGRIVKDNDHIMDATRYGIRTGLKMSTTVETSTVIDISKLKPGGASSPWSN
jgi:phage terminase large subunit-like protein